MTQDIYESFTGSQITDSMITSAASLFSSQYGIWGPLAGSKGGKRVHMSPSILRREVFSPKLGNRCTYVRVIVDGELAGNVFACEWQHEGRAILWVTQLVVDSRFRSKGIAKNLLTKLRQPHVCGYGIASSHAHAIMAAISAFGGSLSGIDFDFVKENAASVMAASPIPYIRDAKTDGRTVDTSFLVDHKEPADAMLMVERAGVTWPLGELPQGHEFLLFMRARHQKW